MPRANSMAISLEVSGGHLSIAARSQLFLLASMFASNLVDYRMFACGSVETGSTTSGLFSSLLATKQEK